MLPPFQPHRGDKKGIDFKILSRATAQEQRFSFCLNVVLSINQWATDRSELLPGAPSWL